MTVIGKLDAQIEDVRRERHLVERRLRHLDHEIVHLQNMVEREKHRIHEERHAARR